MRVHRPLLLLLLLFAVPLAAACGGDPVVPLPGQIELGTVDPHKYGDQRWVDLADGQNVELYPGAQGGFHIWLLYRLKNLSGTLTVKRIADRINKDGSGMARVLTTQGVQHVPVQPEWQLPDPIPNFMCPTPIGVNVIGETIEMTVHVDGEDGRALGEQKVRVVAHCPPDSDPQHVFCVSICAG